MKKVQISTTSAMSILAFMREFIPEGETRPEQQHLSECIDDLNNGISQMPWSEIESAMEDIRIAALLGKSPPMRG